MTDFPDESKRSLVTNVIAMVDQLIDGYRDKETRLSHWVQKDGIQNSWDARKDPNNRKKNWKCVIELHEGKKTIVTITDSGTWGLTGKRLDDKDLDKEQPPSERWCRFENYAFKNEKVKDKHLLGSRGRGKFVFAGASDTMVTLYDTLRADKIYRLGKRVVEKLDAPTKMVEGKLAKEVLDTYTAGMLSPLSSIGARIIIMEPKKDLVDDIKDGTFEKFIGDTWWEIIEKYGARIIVKNGTESSVVKPFTETLPHSLMKQNKIRRPITTPDQKMLIKESVAIPGYRYRIKKLYILYDPDRDFEGRQLGIAIQRGGMNVTRLECTDLGPALSEHMTGYATFEPGFEDELRKTEGIEHYSYNWARSPTKDLKRVLTVLYRDWATEKLGWRKQSEKRINKTDKAANDRARNKANEIAKKMGFGKGPRKTREPPKGTKKKRSPKKVQVQLNDLGFPSPNTERIDYGELLKKIGARVINNTGNDIRVGLKIDIRSERDEQVYGKYIFHDGDFSSGKNSTTGYCCNKTITIDKRNFTPGQYKVHAYIALLTPFGGLKKGQVLDTSAASFFVETDPPEGGIWEKFVAADFSTLQEPENTQKAIHAPGSRPNTYVLEYNTAHAEHKKIEKNDEQAIAQYRYALTIPELCKLDIENEWYTIFNEDDLKIPIRIAEILTQTIDKFTDTKYVGAV